MPHQENLIESEDFTMVEGQWYSTNYPDPPRAARDLLAIPSAEVNVDQLFGQRCHQCMAYGNRGRYYEDSTVDA